MTESDKKIDNYSFEEGLEELENIVRRLEQGGKSLDESISDYTKGVELKKHCEKKLSEAKLKVEKIISDNGDKKLEELDKSDYSNNE